MRPTGVHRGNPTLRVAIGQALRRRLYADITPHHGESSGDVHAARWTREFHDRLREGVLPSMAPIESIDAGELRYFGRPRFSLWSLHTERALVLAYDYYDSPEELRARARRWMECLRTHTAPGLPSRHWGHPVYGARLDSRTGELEVVWAVPGDWMRLASLDETSKRTLDQPLHWSEQGAVD